MPLTGESVLLCWRLYRAYLMVFVLMGIIRFQQSPSPGPGAPGCGFSASQKREDAFWRTAGARGHRCAWGMSPGSSMGSAQAIPESTPTPDLSPRLPSRVPHLHWVYTGIQSLTQAPHHRIQVQKPKLTEIKCPSLTTAQNNTVMTVHNRMGWGWGLGRNRCSFMAFQCPGT